MTAETRDPELAKERSILQAEVNKQIFRKQDHGRPLLDIEEFLMVDRRFPHIGAKIKLLWGTAAFDAYLRDLFLDTRGGTRQGFPPEISFALFRLSGLHDEMFPKEIKRERKDEDEWLF